MRIGGLQCDCMKRFSRRRMVPNLMQPISDMTVCRRMKACCRRMKAESRRMNVFILHPAPSAAERTKKTSEGPIFGDLSTATPSSVSPGPTQVHPLSPRGRAKRE
jgi:hypothetical protein